MHDALLALDLTETTGSEESSPWGGLRGGWEIVELEALQFDVRNTQVKLPATGV
jgi:hypothetical protein